jgi:hypothetical protein
MEAPAATYGPGTYSSSNSCYTDGIVLLQQRAVGAVISNSAVSKLQQTYLVMDADGTIAWDQTDRVTC